MRYKEIIDQVLDNLGIENERTKHLAVVVDDISNTVKEVFGLTRVPIKSYDVEELPDETLTCMQCSLREEENYAFSTKELEKIVFYQLQK